MEWYFQMVIERCSILELGKRQRTISKMDQIFNNTIDTHAANGCHWDKIDTNWNRIQIKAGHKSNVALAVYASTNEQWSSDSHSNVFM